MTCLSFHSKYLDDRGRTEYRFYDSWFFSITPVTTNFSHIIQWIYSSPNSIHFVILKQLYLHSLSHWFLKCLFSWFYDIFLILIPLKFCLVLSLIFTCLFSNCMGLTRTSKCMILKSRTIAMRSPFSSIHVFSMVCWTSMPECPPAHFL